MPFIRGIAVVAALLVLAPRTARAQGPEFQLAAGLYQPFTDQARHTDATTGQSSSYHAGAALAVGVRATAWLSAVFGFDLGAWHASPERTIQAAASTMSPATITVVSVKAMRRFRLGAVTELRIGAGMARLHVGGVSYDTATVALKTTAGGFTVSGSVARALRPRVSLVLGIEDWTYRLNEVRTTPSLAPSGTQAVRLHDLVITLGVAARL